ncbi:2-ketoarginine methyltransferase [Streptomyces azureus]|uniref:Methyltransferase n=1 Tax=Streptomyces azureus TaxID=146537 RepID=A0A0K8PNE5_STRAJ|nr:2-ketoarginine methyltransferase [Streptomyces azureus]GAP48944.1 methyltransferase [Streptomyces azureus]
MEPDFEQRLITAIQPIRGFFLAQCLEFAMTSGLLSKLGEASPTDVDQLAKDLALDPERLTGLLRYLEGEGVVTDSEGSPAITAKGREYLEFRPWYELLIGGYGATLRELPEVMADRTRFASRNGTMVGLGSCGMSRYDAIPLVKRLIDRLPEPPSAVVDLGCGDGTFLLDLCEGGRPGIGVDPHPGSIDNARRAAAERGLSDQVGFVNATAEDYMAQVRPEAGPTPCFVTAFSLQEVLEQKGRDAAVEVVRTALTHTPGAHLAVVEVDHRPLDPAVLRHGLGNAYYNPYYFLHQITEQRLETRAFWDELIAEAGGRIVECLTTAPEVDSTGLELGYLVRGQ